MRWLGALGLADFAAFPAVGRALCEWLPLKPQLNPGFHSSTAALSSLLSLPTSCCSTSWCPRAIPHLPQTCFPSAGSLIGRELQPVYAAVASAAVGSPPAAPALPDRLLELLRVAGQHLYHDITGE